MESTMLPWPKLVSFSHIPIDLGWWKWIVQINLRIRKVQAVLDSVQSCSNENNYEHLQRSFALILKVLHTPTPIIFTRIHNRSWSCYTLSRIKTKSITHAFITARKRSCGKGMFFTPVHRGICLPTMSLGRKTPSPRKQPPPPLPQKADPLSEGRPPNQEGRIPPPASIRIRILLRGDTVKKWAVHILLECTLVCTIFHPHDILIIT